MIGFGYRLINNNKNILSENFDKCPIKEISSDDNIDNIISNIYSLQSDRKLNVSSDTDFPFTLDDISKLDAIIKLCVKEDTPYKTKAIFNSFISTIIKNISTQSDKNNYSFQIFERINNNLLHINIEPKYVICLFEISRIEKDIGWYLWPTKKITYEGRCSVLEIVFSNKE